MQFSEILGQEHIKSHLTKAPIWVESHAQLFVGPEERYVTYGDRLCAIHSMWQSKRRK
jgi:hypothetical protein